jgi:3-oxoacyl-[acyl-carrier-protein] synthase-3
VPLALYEAREQGLLKKGSVVGLVAFGGGLTWAANILRW